MKAVILAGGLGTRISEETLLKPKPMVEIGGKPIIWHIMKCYSHHGINNFIICCGYKGYMIKEYFSNYFIHNSDVTFDLHGNKTMVHHQNSEPWLVTLIDTGEDTQTGGRLKRVSSFLDAREPFCFTYGDGLSDVNITQSIKFHSAHGKIATVTAVSPPGRYGALKIGEHNAIHGFTEKPESGSGSINGGFFVLNKDVIDYIKGDEIAWERQPLEQLAKNDELRAFHHDGFWQPMDTLREKNMLEELWSRGSAPWKIW